MKILNIAYLGDFNETRLVSQTLEKGLFVDPLFESVYFRIEILLEEKDKLTDFMFRVLWETVYLKSKKCSVYYDDKHMIHLYVSLSETISFINVATPVRLRHLIPDSIKKIESITEILKEFLIHDEGVIVDYKSLFKSHIHFQQFETNWTYDKKRMKMLRQFNDTGVVADIEVSNTNISDLTNPDENHTMIITFHCYTKDDIEIVYEELICHQNNLTISNIMKDDTGTYITAFSTDIIPSSVLLNIINRTYTFINS